MADALLLSSQRVLPQKALASGYLFLYQGLESALHSVLGR
jgi:NAD dependent epimerase/dehydratase family enzyme